VTDGPCTVLQTQIANVPLQFVQLAAPAPRSAVPTDTIALAGASGGTATLTGVAAGALSASSTDAVNGSQLHATNQRVDQNTADIQTITNNIAGSTVVAVQYSNPDNPTVSNGGTLTNDVTLVGADSTTPVVLHNVANGTHANDAVNMGQFEAGLSDVLAGSMAYTDRQLSALAFNLENLGHDMRRMRRDAFAGTASAMAVAGIPQTMEPGGRMIGGAIGHYRGETAFALGASSTFNDGRGVAKVGATMDARGHGGFSAGAGFSF
jgi:autotransporter adhesin